MAEAIVMNTFEDIYIPELTMDHLLTAAKFTQKPVKGEEYKRDLSGVCVDEYGITATDGCYLVQFPFMLEVHQLSHADRMMIPIVDVPEWKRLTSTYKEKLKEKLIIRPCIRKDDEKGWMLHAEYGIFQINIGLKGPYPNYHRVCPDYYDGQPIEMGESERNGLVKWLSAFKKNEIVTLQVKDHHAWFVLQDDYNDGFVNGRDGQKLDWTLSQGIGEYDTVHFNFYAWRLLMMLKTLKHTKMEWSHGLSPCRFTGGDGWAILMPCRDR